MAETNNFGMISYHNLQHVATDPHLRYPYPSAHFSNQNPGQQQFLQENNAMLGWHSHNHPYAHQPSQQQAQQQLYEMPPQPIYQAPQPSQQQAQQQLYEVPPQPIYQAPQPSQQQAQQQLYEVPPQPMYQAPQQQQYYTGALRVQVGPDNWSSAGIQAVVPSGPSPTITENGSGPSHTATPFSSPENDSNIASGVSNNEDATAAGPSQMNQYEWMRRSSYQTQSNPGKTRTKEKHRTVYTDFQRLELEKEYRFKPYIPPERKAKLAASIGLSERQVKIWFQNRRAKEKRLLMAYAAGEPSRSA